MDYHYRQNNKFSTASCAMGGLSLLTLFTGVFAIPLGALGVLFAVLSKQGKKMDSSASFGCILSGIGLGGGLALTIFVYVTMFFTMFNNVDFRQIANMSDEQAMHYIMESMYGPEYDAYFESMGVDIDAMIDQMY